MGLTREEAIEKHYDIKCHITESKKILTIINEIYNEHEDAIEMLLKANEEGISRHFNECDKYEAQLKAKDELLDKLHKAYAEAEYECKAKDEEIHYLKTQMTGWSMMFDDPQDAKARLIVAMLFWMMKRQKAIYVKSFNDLGINNHNTSFYKGAYENSKMQFKQAYKMLKDTK